MSKGMKAKTAVTKRFDEVRMSSHALVQFAGRCLSAVGHDVYQLYCGMKDGDVERVRNEFDKSGDDGVLIASSALLDTLRERNPVQASLVEARVALVI